MSFFRDYRAVVGLFFFFAVPAFAEQVALPPEIIATLNTEYPGWIFAKSDYLILRDFKRKQIGHPPYLIWGDFDDDGQRDYAVQIARTNPGDEEQIAIAFLQRQNHYEEVILESRGLDPKVYLMTRKKERANQDSLPDKQKMLELIMIAGGPTGDTTYSYEEKAFHELETTPPSEVPEEP